MPQYLQRVSPERALKLYGVIVIEGSTSQEVQSRNSQIEVNRFTTGGGALIQEVAENTSDPPAKPNGNLF
jgi:hypothetical protein